MLPDRTALQNLKAKWDFLAVQQSFHLAPVRTALRLASWRMRCLSRMPATSHLRKAAPRTCPGYIRRRSAAPPVGTRKLRRGCPL
jgi:hypothetical protein